MQNIKCVLVGDSGVGKTCLLLRYTTNEFPEVYSPRVCFDTMANVMVDGEPINLKIDEAYGQEYYDRLRPLMYSGADVFLLCFSVASPESLESICDKFHREVRHYCPEIPIVLVGTKLDLRDDETIVYNLWKYDKAPVSYAKGSSIAKKLGAVKYVECSALEEYNVKDVFNEAARAAIEEIRSPASKSKKTKKRHCSTL